MSIRLVNNLTQCIKCTSLLTKVKQNPKEIHILQPNGPLFRAKHLEASTAIICSTRSLSSRTKIIVEKCSGTRLETLSKPFGVLSTLTPLASYFFWSKWRHRNARRNDNFESSFSKQASRYLNSLFEFDKRISNSSRADVINILEKQQERKGYERDESRKKNGLGNGGIFIAAFSYNFFGSSKKDEDEDPMDKLVTTIKRSVLCVQRKQYDKAEQMLHLALKMAQDLKSKEGITYVYDLMANLAMEREQFKKAEKLFADVMKRLFADGHGEDNAKVLHISSKLAHMAQLQGELDKAYTGFTWTLERLAKAIKKSPDDRDLFELFGLTKNWFGELLMKQGKYNKAKEQFEEAYACFIDVNGEVNEGAITILNNLSVACMNLDDFIGAKKHLHKALEIAKEFKDSTEEGVLYANLGMVYLQEGLIKEALDSCSLAYRVGKKQSNNDAIEQAEYCLNEIKSSELYKNLNFSRQI